MFLVTLVMFARFSRTSQGRTLSNMFEKYGPKKVEAPAASSQENQGKVAAVAVDAMANLALLLLGDGQTDEALAWARKVVAGAPLYAAGQRAHGKVALAAGLLDEAHTAFERALALEPDNLANKLNLGLVLVRLGRDAEARPLLDACLHDPRLADQARALLGGMR